jgi:membrane-associated phospholipid phosphatase
MLALGLLVIAVLGGLAVSTVVRRWPAKDPSAPRVQPPTIRDTVHKHPRLRTYLRARTDPAKATGLALTAAIVILVVAVTVIGILAAMVRTNPSWGLTRIDPHVAAWVARNDTTSSTRIARFITQFGGFMVIVPLAVLVAVIESVRLRSRAVWGFLLLVVGGQLLLANTIKFLVDRARPTVLPLTGFSGTSFPSGHATAAAATYAAFALLIGKRRSIRVRVVSAGAAVALAVLIGGSRVVLGVHWLTDVIAGLVLGWAWFAVCSLAFGGRFLRFGAPMETAEAAATNTPERVDHSPAVRK